MAKYGETQNAVYEFIREYCTQNGIPPTVREIGAALGLRSTSTVHTHLRNLAQKGMIKFSPSKQRSITLTCTSYSGAESVRVPLIGDIAAGAPILSVENIAETYVLSPAILRGGKESDVFMLEVHGESMIDAGINDGDLVIINNTLSVDNGDIAAVRVGGEDATLKRVFYVKSVVRLQPENTSMQPIIISRQDVEIIGRLIGLFRRY